MNVKLYTRGKSAGIETQGGRRYRFSTLGLAQDYTDTMSRCDLHASKLAELSRIYDERARDNDLELDYEP